MKRYRVIAKALCDDCNTKSLNNTWFDVRCNNCTWAKWNNVTNLIKFTSDVLDKDHPNWVFFNVFEYIKGENGRRLGSYQKNGKRPITPFEL
ncbi:MAG: hypothetical protein COA88_12925 [Kordia sp.]|nr:MAG: hypothetical protein COA88_12925 [Kordia sp.]